VQAVNRAKSDGAVGARLVYVDWSGSEFTFDTLLTDDPLDFPAAHHLVNEILFCGEMHRAVSGV
jgi:hypothetical protein